jgi:hypothetical protein
LRRRLVSARDAGLYEAALDVLRKGTSAEARRAALVYLGERGVDEGTALAEASRPLPQGQPGPLRKTMAADVSVRVPMDAGGSVALEMSRAEANGFVCAVFDALGGRRA